MRIISVDIDIVKSYVAQGYKIQQIASLMQIGKTTLWRKCKEAKYNPQRHYVELYAPRTSEGVKARIKKNSPNECQICGFDRVIEVAHIVPARDGGPLTMWNTLILCPNHHRLFDYFLLDNEEWGKIENRFWLAKKKFQSLSTNGKKGK